MTGYETRVIDTTFGSRGKPSSRILLLIDCPVIHKANGNRAAGDRSRHASAEMQRSTTLQRAASMASR
jgi:hypothetical protein